MISDTAFRGPDGAPTARAFTGLESKENAAYQIFDTHETLQRNKLKSYSHRVAPGEVLRYAVFPVFDEDAGAGFGFESTAVAIDVLFEDGVWLSQMSVHDEAGYPIGAREQYEAQVLSVNQWNEKTIALDNAVGKMITEFDIVCWQGHPTEATPHGWISDVEVLAKPPMSNNPVELIDIRRGTNSSSSFSRGNCIPAVTVPHGFNFGIPLTDADDLSWAYKYHANNNGDNLTPLQGLAISHSATNWGSERNVLHVMPTMDCENGMFERGPRSLGFRHRDEVAHPYLYSVALEHNVSAEMTSTDHVIAMRFRVPPQGGLIFDQYDTHGSLNFDPTNPKFQIFGYNDSTFGGNPTTPRMFFAIQCDDEIASVKQAVIKQRKNVSAVVSFKTGKPIVLRIATSFISLQQAAHALSLEMPQSVSFDEVVERSKRLWEQKLSLLRIENVSEERAVSFASSMYRMFMYPNSASENVGSLDKPRMMYADVSNPRAWQHTDTHTGCDIREGQSYVNNGFWDTYRTIWPAYCLFEPDEAAHLLDGFVEHYRASGWIDRWCAPGPTGGMVGSSADIVIANALISGVNMPDATSAYDAALRDATTVSDRAQVGRFDNAHAIFSGFVSTNIEEGMSWSLEDYLNDFGIAQASRWMFEHASNDDPRRDEFLANTTYFMNRAKYYTQLFNREVGFFMGRTADGEFRSTSKDFDPRVWGGDYTETNAWGMAFSVPFDGYGLASLYGSQKLLESKLDAYFSTPETAHFVGSYDRVIHEMVEARDIRMGMFGLSNQPAHHIAYMYSFTNAPYKTQAIVRESIRRLFLGSHIGQGYPGDEDNGEMSAWYVLSSIGLYPLTPASGEIIITSPSVPHSTIVFPNGARTSIVSHDWSEEHVYIQDVRVNGKPWNSLSIPIDLIRQGIVIDIDLGDQPSSWGTGTNAMPYSLTALESSPTVARDVTLPEHASKHVSASLDKASVLFDDSFDDGVIASPDDWISYDFGESETIGLYTVSLGTAPSSHSSPSINYGWVLEVSDDATEWTCVDTQQNPTFTWNMQTRAFLVSEPLAGRYLRLRIRGNTKLDLRQCEYFAQ